jgi:peptidoglycan/LPS O-acetylase OafA/YrhL
MSNRDGHIAAIDGLRGVAVGLVLMFHSGVTGAGWVGVWIFFVISGFVIAGARTREDASALSFRERFVDFLSRRAFRILPLYVLIVLLGAVVTALTGELGDQYGLQLASLATFTFNILRMWSEYTHSFWSGHLWSLSTEQQFYLLFPIVFFLVPRRILPLVLIGVVLASPLVRAALSEIYSRVIPVQPGTDPDAFRGQAIYQFPLGHFDAFAMGVLLAVWRGPIVALRGIFSALCLITLILWAAFFWFMGRSGLFETPLLALHVNAYGGGAEVWRYSLLSLTASVAICGVLKGVKFLEIPLSFKPLEYVGRISYGVYVFHFPVQWVLQTFVFPGVDPDRFTDAALMFVCVSVVSTALASLSFHAFETPMLAVGRDLRRGASLASALRSGFSSAGRRSEAGVQPATVQTRGEGGG